MPRNEIISKSVRRYSRQASTENSTTFFNADNQDHIATLDEENIEVVPAVGSPLQKIVAKFNKDQERTPEQEDQRKEFLK